MAIEVMSRIESKYIINTDTYFKLLKTIENYTHPDEYNRNNKLYTISNIYYDTDDNYLIRTSIAKPRYKEKLRLRAYGIPDTDDNVFLEIKKKYNGMVNKRRTTFSLSDAYEFLETHIAPKNENGQITNELLYLLEAYNPKPKVYIAYDRKAYFSEDNNVRITFDTNIRTRRYNLKLEDGDFGDKLLDSDTYLMEIKNEKAFPLWLAQLLSECKVYKTAFSKYGTEYTKFLKNGDEPKCLNQFSIQEQRKQQQPSPSHGILRLPQYV